MQYNNENDSRSAIYEIEELNLYKKKKLIINYICSLDIALKDNEILIPTLEGNVKILASEEQYIMIGPLNDIYPIPKALFESRYQIVDSIISVDVKQCIENLGWNVEKIKSCQIKQDSFVYAKELASDIDVFVKHCDSFIHGKKGDYYAVSYEDTNNIYIINHDVMKKTYELIE